MGGKFYGSGGRRIVRTREKIEPHPIWRGIGFIILLITPVLGYFAAILLIAENQNKGWVSIPVDFLYKGQLKIFPNDPLLFVKVGLTIILMFIIYFLLQLIAMIVYRFVAPPRYGLYDVPAIRYRGRKKSR